MKLGRFAGGAAAALIVAALAAMSSPARADALRLTPEMRSHLAGLHHLGGRPLQPRQLHGRAVLVAFFASWCKPCNTDFEHLKLLQLSYAAEGLTIVAVDLNEDKGPEGRTPDAARRLDHFIARHVPVFTVVRGTAKTAKLFGGVDRVPTLMVFDRAGKPHFVFRPEATDGTATASLGELHTAVQNALGLGAAWLPDAAGGPLAFRMMAGSRERRPGGVIPAKAGISFHPEAGMRLMLADRFPPSRE